VAIAVTHLAWIGIVCFPISPWLVIEEWQTLITGITLRVVSTLTNRIDTATASTRVTVAGTSGCYSDLKNIVVLVSW
jgi:hypothetical protein